MITEEEYFQLEDEGVENIFNLRDLGLISRDSLTLFDEQIKLRTHLFELRCPGFKISDIFPNEIMFKIDYYNSDDHSYPVCKSFLEVKGGEVKTKEWKRRTFLPKTRKTIMVYKNKIVSTSSITNSKQRLATTRDYLSSCGIVKCRNSLNITIYPLWKVGVLKKRTILRIQRSTSFYQNWKGEIGSKSDFYVSRNTMLLEDDDLDTLLDKPFTEVAKADRWEGPYSVTNDKLYALFFLLHRCRKELIEKVNKNH